MCIEGNSYSLGITMHWVAGQESTKCIDAFTMVLVGILKGGQMIFGTPYGNATQLY